MMGVKSFKNIFISLVTQLSTQRYLLAIRDGMISTMPLTIIGSLFLILVNLPVPEEWKTHMVFQIITDNAVAIALPFRITTGLLAIYATYNIGYSLAKSYDLDGRSGGTLSLMAFFLTAFPQVASSVVGSAEILQLADGREVNVFMAENINKLGFVLPFSRLGGAGLFAGIFAAILSVEILRFFVCNNLVIKMPSGIPESVVKSFSSFFPALGIMLVMFAIVVLGQVDVQDVFITILNPIKGMVDTPLGSVIIVFLIGLLWSMGVHGGSIVGTIVRPMWVEMITANSEAILNHTSLPYTTPEPFFQWFVWIGGSGGTFSLVVLLFLARSRYLKSLGRVAIIPSLFNINEPLVFGLPIILNPFFVVPFIFGPVLTTIISYLVVSWGWVSIPAYPAPWTFPAFLGAYISTLDWRSILLVFVNIFVLIMVYLPFVRFYDKKMYEEEQEGVS